jgi:hypothetical protein
MLVGAVTEPARVGQQVVDRDLTVSGYQIVAAIRAGDHHTRILEFRQITRNRVPQAQAALFAQQHGGRAGDRLAHRVDPEDGIGFHGALVLEILPAEGFQVGHLSFPGDQGENAGKSTLVQVPFHDGIQAGETGRR